MLFFLLIKRIKQNFEPNLAFFTKIKNMKQVVLNIPDKKYHAFINHVKSMFADIQIKEKKPETKKVAEEDSTYETMLLSEKSLAEDWLSDEDNRWDEVL